MWHNVPTLEFSDSQHGWCQLSLWLLLRAEEDTFSLAYGGDKRCNKSDSRVALHSPW